MVLVACAMVLVGKAMVLVTGHDGCLLARGRLHRRPRRATTAEPWPAAALRPQSRAGWQQPMELLACTMVLMGWPLCMACRACAVLPP